MLATTLKTQSDDPHDSKEIEYVKTIPGTSYESALLKQNLTISS